jgi:hypothetical protein
MIPQVGCATVRLDERIAHHSCLLTFERAPVRKSIDNTKRAEAGGKVCVCPCAIVVDVVCV